jgi:soluble lytic murein transglycosylase-like protein
VGWQESGFNQTLTSRTGAIGVMQVEPYTGIHISALLGRPFNLYNVDDNVHAGVFWLSHLLAYYGGNERLAIAAYYQGTRSIAEHGFFQDTIQYVADVLSLESSFGG